MKKCLPIYSIFLFFLVLTGCSHFEYREIEGKYEGLKTSMEKHRHLKLLVIHGMGLHKPGYAQGLVDAIAKQMGMTPQFKYSIVEIRREATPDNPQDNNGRVYGYMRVQDYVNKKDDMALRLYELTWSPTTQPIKDQFLGYDSFGKYQKHRIYLNQQLKSQLMNERMSEPVLYIGKYKKEMQYPLKWAIRRMLDDEFGPGNDEIVIITASLGSYMVYDTITNLGLQPEDRRINTEEFFAKLTTVIMLANQLPLLLMSEVSRIGDHLGESWEGAKPKGDAVKSAGASWFESPVMRNFVEMRNSAFQKRFPGQPVPDISLVAINDPNDILSYPLPGYLDRDDDYVNYVNVTLNIAKIRWSTLLANPITAHTGHEDNSDVIYFIVNGEFPPHPEAKEKVEPPLIQAPSLSR